MTNQKIQIATEESLQLSMEKKEIEAKLKL
jgi:hypothetical protein